jgi:hypothetical protein
MSTLNFLNIENENHFNKWYDYYYNNLVSMYNILINNLRNKKIRHKYIDFNNFCIFIYNNSSKIILKGIPTK